ncbi:MAG: hypothetical protein Q9202_001126 [Teloschistes flavicans]
MALTTRNNLLQITHHTYSHRTVQQQQQARSYPSDTTTNIRPRTASTSSTAHRPSNTSPEMLGLSKSPKPPTGSQHADTPPTAPSHPCCFTTGTSSSPPTRHLFKTPLTVLVGPKKLPFHVHHELFTAVSPFFAAALNPSYSFAESGGSSVSLPAARPDDFEYLVQWIYTRTLAHEDISDRKHPAYFRLIRLWVLADELQVEGARNAVVDFMAKVADRSNSVPTPDDTRMVFGSCDNAVMNEEGESGGDAAGGKVGMGMGMGMMVREGAGLRKLVVDLFAWKKTDHLVEGHDDSWDENFLRLLVGKLKRMDASEKGRPPWREPAQRCKLYHEHSDHAVCGGSDD